MRFFFGVTLTHARCVPPTRGFLQGSRRKPENLAGWFLKKNIPWGPYYYVWKFRQCLRQLLVDVRCAGGAGTCHDPSILGGVLDSAFMQARVRLSCMNETNMHGSSNIPAPRLTSTSSRGCQEYWRNFSTEPPGRLFLKIIRLNSSFGTPEGTLSSRSRNSTERRWVSHKNRK